MTASSRTNRIAWLLLAAAIAASATWLLLAARGIALNGDDIFYYAHFVARDGVIAPVYGLEYFFAPANGHLQVIGRAIYEVSFAIAGGGNYWVLQAFNLVGVMACVVLLFAFARPRIGPIPALIPCLSLLFLGYGWEAFLWAFDMHTIYALAFGLGALLLCERGDRAGDIGACVLLVLSIGMIEVGLAFAAGAAVAVLLRPDRWRRVWIFLVPLALYAAWWMWARQFDQSSIMISNIRLLPSTEASALAAIAGSVFGLNPTGADVYPTLTGISVWGWVLAAVVAAAVVFRIVRGKTPPELWAYLTVAFCYWALIALADRPPDSSRYIFAGTTLVYFVIVAALKGVSIPWKAVAVAACVVAFAIPPNVQKLEDGRGLLLAEAKSTGVEYGALDLTRGQVDEGYVPALDPRVQELGGTVFVPLSAGDYLAAADRNGPLGFSPEEIREQDLQHRGIADATLVGALKIRLAEAPRPSAAAPCPAVLDANTEDAAYFELERRGVLLGGVRKAPVEVGLSRFSEGLSAVPVGELTAKGWAALRLPPDSASEPWLAVVNGPVYVCPLP